MKQFNAGDFKVMPWKNGGGTTTELFRLADPDGEEFLFRLSVAEVKQDGPFSLFPQVDRTLLILNGNGCTLNDNVTLSPKSSPYYFQGEEKIFCKLIQGCFQDFNVMIKRGWKKVKVKRGKFSSCSSQDMTFVYLVESKILYQLHHESITFPEQDAVIVSVT